MILSRHFLTVNGRTVHYRRCGSGPALLMVHQSPRSSAEYEGLMQQWGAHFTCIAPDTPGFGLSDPLADPLATGPLTDSDPDINAYADALVEFVRALGLETSLAYGFHSGGIVLVTALRRHPNVFSGLAVGGYAIWTAQETALLGDAYLPPFRPSAYGEHLTWLWNRVLEQSWFFPWFDTRDAARLPVAHDDPARVHAVITDMLESGDAYRLGYGAVLRAPRDIPPVDAVTPPVLITAYDGDPLQAHIDRLGGMPAGWSAAKVETPKAHQDASLAFLRGISSTSCPPLAEDATHGFLHITTGQFSGLIHWRGVRPAQHMILHSPGRELGTAVPENSVAIDLPGHGLSSAWPGEAPTDWPTWQAVIDATMNALGAQSWAAPTPESGDADRLFPDLSPDRFGSYLTTAWSIIRARQFFAPWYEANSSTATIFTPEQVEPEHLAREHRALLRATAAKAYHLALIDKEGS
jgi:haloalkane dehalogenase